MSVPGISLEQMYASSSPGINPFLSSDGGVFATADLLLIMLGLNDAHEQIPADQISTAFHSAINQYQSVGVIDLMIIVPPAGDSSYNNTYFNQYRALLPALAANRSVALLDMNNMTVSDYASLCNEGFYAYTPNQGSTACLYPGLPSLNTSTANGVHPSDKGHWNMAYVLFPWLASPQYNASDIVTITTRTQTSHSTQ